MSERIEVKGEVIGDGGRRLYGGGWGDWMKDWGIDEGEVVVIEKGVEGEEGEMVVGLMDGELRVKRVGFEDNEKCMWVVGGKEE